MEITVSTCLFAEWDVDIDTCHCTKIINLFAPACCYKNNRIKLSFARDNAAINNSKPLP
jgi:hypothetical protein